MNCRSRAVFSVVFLLGLAAWSGCCCCNPAAFAPATGTSSPASSPSDPEEAEELATGTEYAQKALSKLGYGEVATAALRKDGLYWYVEGSAEGKEGGTVNYIVMFQVSKFDNRQTWAAKTVSIDGETVFPK